MPKILCVIPALPQDEENAKLAMESVKRQTIPVQWVCLIKGRGQGKTVAERVSDSFNKAFPALHLENYDYLLRVDADTVIPPNFLEENLKLNAHVVGGGHAHLIHIPTFLKIMNGRFHKDSDDSYLNYKFIHEGYIFKELSPKALPNLWRKAGAIHRADYFVHRGYVMWLCGYEPLHVLGQWRWYWKDILCIYGYFWAMFTRKPQTDVHKTVFMNQLKTLKRGITRRRRY